MARGRPAPNPTCACGHSRSHHLKQGSYTAKGCFVDEPTTGRCTCTQFKLPAPAGLTTPAESIARAQEVIDDARAALPIVERPASIDAFDYARNAVDESVAAWVRGDDPPPPSFMREQLDQQPVLAPDEHDGWQLSLRWWECSRCHDVVDVAALGKGAAHTHQLFECPMREGHTPTNAERRGLDERGIVSPGSTVLARMPAPATLPVPPPPPTVYEPPPPPPPSAARAERLRLLDQIEQAEAYHASLGRAYQVENEKLGAAIASERAASRMLIDARRSLDEAREQLARSIGAHQVLPVSVSAETLRLASQGS